MNESCSSEPRYVVFDVEAIDTKPFLWSSIAIVTACYPSGQIIGRREFFVDRTETLIKDEKTAAFWRQHPEAWDYNMNRGRGICETDAEHMLCEYINDLKQTCPNFYAVFDNPNFDNGVIDKILEQHGFEPLSIRASDTYAQPICVWSYQMNLSKIFGCKRPHLFSDSQVCRLMKVNNIADNKVLSYYTNRPVECAANQKDGIKHTALYDCYCILANFFKCLDISEALRQLVNGALVREIGPGPPLMSPGYVQQQPENADAAQRKKKSWFLPLYQPHPHFVACYPVYYQQL